MLVRSRSVAASFSAAFRIGTPSAHCGLGAHQNRRGSQLHPRASGASPLVQKRGNTGPPSGSSPPSRCTSSRIQSSSILAPLQIAGSDAIQHFESDGVRLFAGVEQLVLPVFLDDEERQRIPPRTVNLFAVAGGVIAFALWDRRICSRMSCVTSSELPSRASSAVQFLAVLAEPSFSSSASSAFSTLTRVSAEHGGEAGLS